MPVYDYDLRIAAHSKSSATSPSAMIPRRVRNAARRPCVRVTIAAPSVGGASSSGGGATNVEATACLIEAVASAAVSLFCRALGYGHCRGVFLFSGWGAAPEGLAPSPRAAQGCRAGTGATLLRRARTAIDVRARNCRSSKATARSARRRSLRFDWHDEAGYTADGVNRLVGRMLAQLIETCDSLDLDDLMLECLGILPANAVPDYLQPPGLNAHVHLPALKVPTNSTFVAD